jgi:hypothetical protein
MQTWATRNAGEVICEGCGAVYAVSIYKLPCRDSDSFDCEVCGHKMKTWNSTMVPSFKFIRGKLEGS